MSYAEFLESKQREWTGEPIAEVALPDALFPFQRDVVRWALRKGRCALWADTGLGKTLCQAAWSDQIVRGGGSVLILAPLAVTAQTARECARFGIAANVARSQSDVRDGSIAIANYEMLQHFDPEAFTGVVLDESSILKSFMGVTKRRLVEAFAQTRYRLCCTATPAPNDYLELGNHADFLGVMPSNEMIMRWFTNDPMEAGNYRLKQHGAESFWRWLSSWAISLTTPSDIGHSDEGFVLPALTVHQRSVGFVEVAPTDGRLFVSPDVSATALHATMRASAPARAAAAAEAIHAEPDESWLIWVNTDYDADALREALGSDGLVEVRGSDSPDVKAERLLAFADGKSKRLMTKPQIAGMGLNLQVCARVIFVGLSFSYEQYYQALRRTWRFGQTREVVTYAFSAENEWSILQSLKDKAAQHEALKREMIAASRDAVTAELRGPAVLVSDEDVAVAEGDNWTLYNGDCVRVTRGLADASVDFSVMSPPFSNLYVYSDRLADMGNASDHDEFFKHFSYLIRELHRVTVPGRLCAIHCKDLPLYKSRDGSAGLFDFPGYTIRAFTEAGWTFHSRVTIWKDPVIEMQRTKNHGLLYKQLRKDSSASRMGMADYVLAFRKWEGIGDTTKPPKPVTHTREEFTLDQWQKWASPVWDDIQQTRVLQYQQARDDEDERHICPLQLDVIERCIKLWSNPGDLVLSPFAGIGSEGYEAIRLGRRFVGIELKPSYWTVAARNLRLAAEVQMQGTLFEEPAAESAEVLS